MRTIFGIFVVALLTVCASAQMREWEDNTGGFKVRAEMVSSDGTEVTLRKENGTTTKVPIARLSEDDQSYVKGYAIGFSAVTSFADYPLWAKACIGGGL